MHCVVSTIETVYSMLFLTRGPMPVVGLLWVQCSRRTPPPQPILARSS